jgi:hypothetical protein
MIKRVRFATRRADIEPDDFAVTWLKAASAVAADCPDGVRPLRATLCTGVPGVIDVQKHDGVDLQWFTDVDHLERFDGWQATVAIEPAADRLRRVLDGDASPVIVVDEAILRGADWLEQRWRRGGVKLKHMAIAKRADGLSPDEFSERWRSRAGTLKRSGSASAIPIPEGALGNAYVQNHPIARGVGEWAYDAFNEVYFDELDDLRRRSDWFAESLGMGTEDDLVSQNWFLVASEEVLIGSPGAGAGAPTVHPGRERQRR